MTGQRRGDRTSAGPALAFEPLNGPAIDCAALAQGEAGASTGRSGSGGFGMALPDDPGRRLAPGTRAAAAGTP